MKRNSFLFLISLLLITGCHEDSSILEPLYEDSSTELSKTRPIFRYNSSDQILSGETNSSENVSSTNIFAVGKKSDGGSELKNNSKQDVKIKHSKTLTINGEKGGIVYLSHKFATTISGQNKNTKLSAKLDIPCGAFSGELTFDIIFDIENLAVELYPSPYTFDKPVLLNLEFKNVDLSGFDPSIFVFDYLDGKEPENLKVKSAKIDIKNNKLSIKEAELHHFSRYGWTRNKSGH